MGEMRGEKGRGGTRKERNEEGEMRNEEGEMRDEKERGTRRER